MLYTVKKGLLFAFPASTVFDCVEVLTELGI